ncbi:helix-turn-helix domain-containing protein [Paenibacillus sp. KS-LC4]|uniref:helix-turn-helix domain-containing protein n=1 Tax=Paenibacillus sp. KS-LC4 TaxID=2979727 RepID=UPI0030CB7CC5
MWNVLLVDDEPGVLEGLKMMIDWEKYGFQVCGEALNGPDAWNFIKELRPELVFTDIRMPIINGLELIEKTNRLLSRPPKFVILSGYDDFQYALTAARQRVAEYLLKPIDDEEIEALLIKLNHHLQEKAANEKNRMKQHYFAVSHLVNRLIQGEYNTNLEQQVRLSLQLQEKPGELRCILIDTLSFSVDLRQQVSDFFSQDITCSFQDSIGRTGVLIQSSSNADGALHEKALLLQTNLVSKLEQPVIIAISDRGEGIPSIRELYLQALQVWKQKRAQGKSGVFYFHEVERRIQRHVLSKLKFRQLPEIVAEGSLLAIENGVEEAFHSIAAGEMPDIKVARAYVADLELTICRLLAERNGNPDTFMMGMEREHGSLGGKEDYPALKDYVRCLCVETANVLHALNQQNENNTIFHMIQYVDREYRNKLQMHDLAKHFHMNSAYLGQLFKKHTGKSFNVYLNEKRIEEAKRLLKRTQMKISDVAQQVGYPKVDYFINKFKMHTGVLPSVFKTDFENRKR